MKKIVATLAISVAAAIAIAPVAASANKPAHKLAGEHGGKHHKRGGHFADLTPEQRAELKARVQTKMQTYVATELSTRIGLDAQKSAKLHEALKAHGERRHKAKSERRAAMEKLRSMADHQAPDAELKAQLKQAVEQDREEALQALLDDTSKCLTPTEQAKLVTAFPEVMKEARTLVKKAKGKHGKGGFDK